MLKSIPSDARTLPGAAELFSQMRQATEENKYLVLCSREAVLVSRELMRLVGERMTIQAHAFARNNS
jgi:hypothetical protein